MSATDIRAARSRAAAASLRSRWGEGRAPSKQVRVDADAADMLSRVPERDRRAVATDGVRRAVAEYFAERGARDMV